MTTHAARVIDDLLTVGGDLAETFAGWEPPGLTYLERAHEAERRRRVLEAWDHAVITARAAPIGGDHAA